jgi:aromatic-L-amino-acid decarboxylase
VEWIAEYLEHPERYPVKSRVGPGDIRRALPDHAPAEGEPLADIMRDFHDTLVLGGARPLGMLDARVEAWIAAKR